MKFHSLTFQRFCVYRFVCVGFIAALIFAGNELQITKARRADKTQINSPKSTEPSADSRRLEIIEELSESLANDLLELSVATRDGDLETTNAYFPAFLTARPFPSKPLETKKQVKWIGLHAWETPGGNPAIVNASVIPDRTGKITSKAFLKNWADFLGHFSEIEDARFKVKEANFDEKAEAVLGAEEPTAVLGAKGKARIAFYAIGRDIHGKREWDRGTF